MIKKLLLSMLLCLFLVPLTIAQVGSITGQVTDSRTGEALPGVNLYISQLERGAATDFDGNYSIQNVPYGTYNVRVTFVGYLSVTRSIVVESDENTLNIELREDLIGLEEIVVTGYTEQSRNRITGSITTVSTQQIENIPVASFEQMLQGRSPGVFISSGSGQPGDASTVRIRGSGSITGGNTPLYVMDGIPINANDFASINPNDIENISILKDASATSQYGSRGSNGVILVTTKRGRAGQNQIRYSAQFGASVAGDMPFDMMNTEEKLQLEETLRTGRGWASSPDNPNATLDRSELLAINNNWTDIFFRTGYTQSHDLSVSGGTETIRYFVSGNVFGQEGIGIRSSLDRYSLRINTDINANDYFDFGFNGQGSYSESSFPPGPGVNLANPFAAAYLANPYERLFDDDGNVAVGSGNTGANAFDRLDKDISDRNEIKFVGQTYGRFNLDRFAITQEVSMDFRERYITGWTNPNSYAGQLVSQGNSGALNRATNRLTQFTSNTNVRFRDEIAENHQIDVYVANEFIRKHFEGFGLTGFGLNPKLGPTPASITPGSPTNNMIPTVPGGQNFITQNTLWSVFGIADYSFDNTYNLKATLRRDGSSRFGAGNQFAWLWSLGASWVASNEDFISNIDPISSLIFRASYGKTGNQFGIDDYQSLATFATSSFDGQPTIFPNAPGNRDLQWETAYKLNIGVDFSLFDDWLTGSVDVYNENTKDLFIDQELSRTSGFTNLEINAGSMRNRGIELNIAGDVIRTSRSVLNLNFNYAYNSNEITDLGQVDEFELGTSIVREGLPLGTHYEVEWAGVDPATGAPLYVDLDGNVTTQFSNSFAKAEFGTWMPHTTGGFGLDYSYRGLAVRAQFNYSYGNNLYNNQSFFTENHGFAQFNQSRVMLNMWQQPGDITEIQSNQYPRQFSSKDIEDASYIRFRNLMVSYTVPGSIFNDQVRNVRVFVQGQNLHTWTAFTGFDPEDYNNVAQYAYPLPRIFTAGIDINF